MNASSACSAMVQMDEWMTPCSEACDPRDDVTSSRNSTSTTIDHGGAFPLYRADQFTDFPIYSQGLVTAEVCTDQTSQCHGHS